MFYYYKPDTNNTPINCGGSSVVERWAENAEVGRSILPHHTMKKGLPKPIVDRFRKMVRIRINRAFNYIIANTPEIVWVLLGILKTILSTCIYYTLVLFGIIQKINDRVNDLFSKTMLYFELDRLEDLIGYKTTLVYLTCY